MYHINDKSPIAITYNDSSVLENFHVSETFKILMKEENNLLCKLEKEEWRLVRRRMIDCILATDMANHAKHLNTLKAKLETFDIKNGKNLDRMIFADNVAKTYENQQMVLNMCVHSADVSNPAKPAHLNKIWVEKVFVEFFNQGDIEKEKSLPVSLLCDRETTNINKSQIGFINFVVVPTFETLMHIIPQIHPYMDIIKGNLKRYESILQEEENNNICKNNIKKP
jgi:cAMP-specific phosphodiesterase 4